MVNEIEPINFSQKICLFLHPQTSKVYFFLYPSINISREVESIIASLKIQKVFRFLDTETKFFKYSKSSTVFT